MIERSKLPYPHGIVLSPIPFTQIGINWHHTLNERGWLLLMATRIIMSEYKRTD